MQNKKPDPTLIQYAVLVIIYGKVDHYAKIVWLVGRLKNKEQILVCILYRI